MLHRFLSGLGVALTVGLGLGVLPVGCTKKAPSTEYNLPVAETLRINILQEPPTLDWNKSTDTTSSLIVTNVMQGLVEYDYSDPELGLKPALATQWKSNKDASEWTFTLREGVKWIDGVPFVGQQVLDGWERLLNPKTASEYAYFLFGIKNARAYNEGKIKDFSQVGAKLSANGKEIVVKLEQPKSYFPYLMTHTPTYPIRKDVIEKHGDKWTEAANMVSLGPFKLKIWEHDKSIVLERNDNYFGDKAKVRYILAYMINEMSTALNLFDSGKIDLQPALPSREIGQLRTRKEYREKGILGIFYMGFNVKKAPFDNLKVRKAIAHAIDRKEVTTLLAGGQMPLTSWVPGGMFGHEPERGLKFDVELANQLLDEAGYKDRSGFPAVQFSFNTNEDHQRVAENIQAQLKKNLNINVELMNEEWKVYLSSLKSDPPGMWRLGWLADYPDPDNFLNLMTSFSDNNHTGWGSKKFDELIYKAVSLTDKEARRKIYSEAQKILTEDEVPVVPVFSMVSHILVSDRVQGLPLNSLQRFFFREVSLK